MAGEFFEKHLKPIQPMFADISYGPYERNVLDFWKAESDKPTPLVIHIHGGGFIGGDKSGVREWGKRQIEKCLANGVSFASINYRFRNTAPLTDILLDVARAVQFLRYTADEWNVDKERIAAFGGSAGAGSSLWLAFHDDLADPENDDPVLRESTRITAAGAFETQATYDCEQWTEIVGASPSWMDTYDFNEDLEFYHITRREVDSPRGREIRKKLDMLGMIDPDDSPVYLCNEGSNTDPKGKGHIIHHPRHAVALKKKCDEKGVEAVLILEDTPPDERVDILDFFFRHLMVK